MVTRAHLYTSSGQAPYHSFRRKRQNSFILLPLLSPQSFATLRGPHEVSCALPRACGRMEDPTHPHWRLAPHRENCIFPATACAVYPFASPTKQNTLLRQAVPFHGAESRRSEVNRYRNLSLQHQDHQSGEWQVSRCRCCLPKRRENHKRMGRHNP